MANTWFAMAEDVNTGTAGKDQFDLLNGASSSTVLRVYELYAHHKYQATVSGGVCSFDLTRITNATGGSTVTPTAMTSSTSALNANVSAGTGRTLTGSTIFRRFTCSNDELDPAAMTANDSFLAQINLGTIFAQGHVGTVLEPLTLRAGYGVAFVTLTGSDADGFMSFGALFTEAAS